MRKNLLVITQAVDEHDSNLAFFCLWLGQFAVECDRVFVIANRVGIYHLPKHVIVTSLGKEKGYGILRRLLRFWRLLWVFGWQSKGVFVHMCPEYIVRGAWILRLFGKRIGLWYLHRSVPLHLRIASLLVHRIFTAHEDGIRLRSKKILVTGHGIDTRLFFPGTRETPRRGVSPWRFLTVGRITCSKHIDVLIEVIGKLVNEHQKDVILDIVGVPYTDEDRIYETSLHTFVEEHGLQSRIDFIGKKQHHDMPDVYRNTDLFLNASTTGGIDKAVLEAMSCRIPVITSNEAFHRVLPSACLFETGDLEQAIEKVLHYQAIDTQLLQDIVGENHSIQKTIHRIVDDLFLHHS